MSRAAMRRAGVNKRYRTLLRYALPLDQFTGTNWAYNPVTGALDHTSGSNVAAVYTFPLAAADFGVGEYAITLGWTGLTSDYVVPRPFVQEDIAGGRWYFNQPSYQTKNVTVSTKPANNLFHIGCFSTWDGSITHLSMYRISDVIVG